MKWIARVFVFTTALVFGTFVGSLFSSPASGLSDHTLPVAPALTTPAAEVKTPLNAQNLRGTWNGNWGRNDGECTIEIRRVEGDAFYGTLTKQGAEILFEGTFNPQTRQLFFEETRVVRLGAHMGHWSLGKNIGFISPDGRTLIGSGHDEWGQYAWTASNY